MIPSMSFQSSASSDAKSGSYGNGGINALQEGDWVINNGNGTASASSSKPLLIAAGIAAAVWFLSRKKS